MKNLKIFALGLCALIIMKPTCAMELDQPQLKEEAVIRVPDLAEQKLSWGELYDIITEEKIAEEERISQAGPLLKQIVKSHFKHSTENPIPNPPRSLGDDKWEYYRNNNGLIDACVRDNRQEVLIKLAQGAKVNALPIFLYEQAEGQGWLGTLRMTLGYGHLPYIDDPDYGASNALLFASKFKNENVARLLVKFQKELNRSVLELLFCLKQIPVIGSGGNKALQMLVKLHLKDYLKNLYCPMNQLLNRRSGQNLRACELLPLDCLVPEAELASVKDVAQHRYNQLAYRSLQVVCVTLEALRSRNIIKW